MSSLKQISTKILEKELSKRKEAKIAFLKEKLDKVQDKINSLTSLPTLKPASVGGPLAKIKKIMKKTSLTSEKKNLKSYILDLAKDGNVRTNSDFETALIGAGWATKSEKPYYLIAAALTSLAKDKQLNRISKGKYQINSNH